MVKNLIIRRKGQNMKLPIGISTFKEIREDYLYVDKTKYIFEFKITDEDPLKEIKQRDILRNI